MGGYSNQSPQISVVVVCLDAADTIRDCLTSIVRQTHKPAEIVVVDGFSSDDTVRIVEEFIICNSAVSLISERDKGISDAFNKAIERAKSPYVCFLNADDEMEPRHLELAVPHLVLGADIVLCDVVFGSIARRYLSPRFPDVAATGKLKWFAPQVNHPGSLIKRKLWREVDGFDVGLKVAMDVDFMFKCSVAGAKISLTHQPSVFQREYGKSQFHWIGALNEVSVIERRFGRGVFGSTIGLIYRLAKQFIKHALGRVL